jgi:Protein of unknown function (DUF3761)/Bacterial SH3 domain
MLPTGFAVLKMKKFYFLLLQMLFITIAHAQHDEQVTASVNLRESPDINSSVIVVIPKGAHVVSYERSSNDTTWVLALYKGSIGYISASYIRLHGPELQNFNSTYKAGTNQTRVKYYTNSDGEKVQSQTYYDSPPPGATALCRDGTYSFSTHRRGTCSHHGGVAKWLQ